MALCVYAVPQRLQCRHMHDSHAPMRAGREQHPIVFALTCVCRCQLVQSVYCRQAGRARCVVGRSGFPVPSSALSSLVERVVLFRVFVMRE